jgi:hypothetical protein
MGGPVAHRGHEQRRLAVLLRSLPRTRSTPHLPRTGTGAIPETGRRLDGRKICRTSRPLPIRTDCAASILRTQRTHHPPVLRPHRRVQRLRSHRLQPSTDRRPLWPECLHRSLHPVRTARRQQQVAKDHLAGVATNRDGLKQFDSDTNGIMIPA